MKLKYININGYGVLVDESAEISVNDIVCVNFEYSNRSIGIAEEVRKIFISVTYPDKSDYQLMKNRCAKIIFAEKELNLDVPVLPDWREWEVEQYSISKYPGGAYDEDIARECFIEGYSHNKAKYTEEQVRNLVASVTEFMSHNEPEEFDEWFEKKLKTLQKYPQYIVMESEGIYRLNDDGEKIGFPVHGRQPKFITNSQGKHEGIIEEIIY